MPRSVALAISLLLTCSTYAQEKLPPRFEPLTKNDRFRLVRVLGMPELQPNFGQTSAISADGKWALYAEDLSSGSDEKPRLRTRLLLWDLQAKTWPREFEIDGKSVTALDLARDGGKALLAGQFIAAIGNEKEKKPATARACLILFDLHTGKTIRTIETMDSQFQCVALAPDESTALTASLGKLKHWDLKQDKDIAVYDPKNAAPIAVLAYLPGGKQFLAGYNGGEVRLWNVGQDKPVRTFGVKDQTSVIWQLAVSRDGKRFAAADLQAAVTLWDTESGKELGKLPAQKRPDEEFITGLALADDGKTVFAVWGKSNPAPDDFRSARLVTWDGVAKKTLSGQSRAYRGRVPIRILGERLLIGGGPNLFEAFEFKPGKKGSNLAESWGGHKSPVNALAVLPNGEILSAGQEGAVMTWRAGQISRKYPAHTGAISVLTLSRDEKQWLSAGADQTIRLYAAGGDKPVHLLKGHTGPVASLAFSQEGWACSGSADRSVKTWDLATGKEIAAFSRHAEGVNAVALSPDDLWLASGSDDTTIRVWPIKDGKPDPDRDVITLEGHKKPVTCLTFSPDGKTLISGSQDQTLKVWDWAKEKAIRTIPGHKNWITSLLLVDAKTVLTTSDDLTLCWWEIDSGKEIGRVDFGAVGDCPRCLARLGPDRLLVGTSSWLIYELQMLPAKQSSKGAGSSK
jgi:WD40 repeat protein